MTTTRVRTATCEGTQIQLVEVECGEGRGYAGIQLLGNTSELCKDGIERAKSAIEACGIAIPTKKLILSVTPADIKGDGNQFDLPFALALGMQLCDRPPALDPTKWLFVGELGLAGELRPVRGIVPFAIEALASGLEGMVVAPGNLEEVAALERMQIPGFDGLQIVSFRWFSELLEWLFTGTQGEESANDHLDVPLASPGVLTTFDDMVLSPELELVAKVVATGRHNLLLRGTPGTGKSMFAARLPSILPAMSQKEHLECLRIQSLFLGRIPPETLAGRPPFRAPHHQSSASAVLGNAECPGELALGHGGVLFLDELPEFRRDILESLREPLETGQVRVSRVQKKTIWNARVILLAACNNCPCGWHGSRRRRCSCSPSALLAYRNRLSGPVLDRIDLHVNVAETVLEAASFYSACDEVSQTEAMCASVVEARARAVSRNRKFGVEFNADLPARGLQQASGIQADGFAALVRQTFPPHASARAVTRSLRVARTLADVDGRERVEARDFATAWGWQVDASALARGESSQALRGSVSTQAGTTG